MKTNTKTKTVFRLGQGLVLLLPSEFVKWSGLKPGDKTGVVYDSERLVLIVPKKQLTGN